jgi:dihydroorotate dehydrogenase (fumarate)
LEQKVFGLEFSNPLGVSEGFDKDARIVKIMPDVGFGFAQVGTITPGPWAGNQGPHLYRLPKVKSLVVNFGLKNQGQERVFGRLAKIADTRIPVSASVAAVSNAEGVNVENYLAQYLAGVKMAVQQQNCSIITMNISCPNICARELFTLPQNLELLLTETDKLALQKPLLLKMPVDKSWQDFSQLLDIILQHKVSGVIISNLTKNPEIREQLNVPNDWHGGLSGMAVQEKSTELISRTYQKVGKRLIIIGVGGIFSAEDAYEKIKAGASLLQLITGMVFQGPQTVGKINARLVELLQQDGYQNIGEAVGSAHKAQKN